MSVVSVALPETSLEHYLTGSSALQILTEDGDFADWHFDATFLISPGARFRVAGVNYPSTQAWFGLDGVRECSKVMRACGVALADGTRFYAANYWRAVLDLVIVGGGQHLSLSHVQAAVLLDEADWRMVLDRLNGIRGRIDDAAQWRVIDQWIEAQRLILDSE